MRALSRRAFAVAVVEGSASVSPDQDWGSDGTADCRPLAPFPDTATRNLPLEHRASGAHTIRRSAYPQGLVIVWDDSPVSVDPADLHIRGSTGTEIQVSDDDHQSWPDGIAVWFLN